MASSSGSLSSLSSVIDRDLLAADFLVSIFWSAMTSFRHDTILRPFPPGFVDDQNLSTGSHKNLEKLVRRNMLCSISPGVGVVKPESGVRVDLIPPVFMA